MTNEGQAPAPRFQFVQTVDDVGEIFKIMRGDVAVHVCRDGEFAATLCDCLNRHAPADNKGQPTAGAVEAAFREGYYASLNSKGVEGAWETSEAIRSLPSSPLTPAPLTCEWVEEDPDASMWATGCKKEFVMTAGTPAENDMNFCCFCSGKIIPCPPPNTTKGEG